MKQVRFGPAGIKVSEICLGTMTFGNEADEKVSIDIMNRAFDAGVNFFDTADVYNRGLTEEIVGRWLESHRNDIVLASKVHFPTGTGVNDRGSSRRHILTGVERSLRRLQTDRLDVLYLHHWDATTPIDESLAALSHLVDQGKVLYCAVSNFAGWQCMKAVAAARDGGWAPIVATQPMYNLVKRAAEIEILPMAQAENIAVCPYSPMGAGLLTGKYQRNETGRITSNPMYQERFKDPEYMDISNRFVEYALARGLPPAALSVSWVLGHPAVTAAIIGARNVDQLDLALSATGIELDESARSEITALSIDPPLATDRERASLMPFSAKEKEKEG